MYFVLDVVCVLIMAVCVARFMKASIPAALIKTACVLLSAAVAVVASIPCAVLVEKVAVAPMMERSAANALADMVSAPHLDSGRETAKQLNLDELVTDCPPAFEKWVERYHGDVPTVCYRYRSTDAENMLVTLLSPQTQKVSRALSYLVLWILIFLLLRYFVWRLELNSAPPQRKRGDRKNLIPPLIGLLYGVSVVWGIAVLLQWMIPPLDGIVPLASVDMLTKGAVYPIMRLIDPLYWLAKI